MKQRGVPFLTMLDGQHYLIQLAEACTQPQVPGPPRDADGALKFGLDGDGNVTFSNAALTAYISSFQP